MMPALLQCCSRLPSIFPCGPRLTSEQPQPLDSGIALPWLPPVPGGRVSQEVIDYSRCLLQGLLIRASGLPSSLFAPGPAPPLPWSFPALRPVLFWDLDFIDSLALFCSHCILAPNGLMALPIGLPVLGLHRSTFHTLALSIRNCAAQFFICIFILLFYLILIFFFFAHLLLTYLDLPIFWVFYLKEGWWHVWCQ